MLCDQDGIPAAEEDLPHGAPGAAKQNRISENPGEKKRPHVGIAVTVHSSCMPFPSTVQIVPPVVTLGMGCRKGKEADAVYEAAKGMSGESLRIQEGSGAACQYRSEKRRGRTSGSCRKMGNTFFRFQ